MTTLLEKALSEAASEKSRAKAHDDFLTYHAGPLLRSVSDAYMACFTKQGLGAYFSHEIKDSDYGKQMEIRVGSMAKPAPGAPNAAVCVTLQVHDMAELVAAHGVRAAAQYYTDVLCSRTQRQLDCPRPSAVPQP